MGFFSIMHKSFELDLFPSFIQFYPDLLPMRYKFSDIMINPQFIYLN